MSLLPFGSAPATLKTITNLGTVIRNQGYSVIGTFGSDLSQGSLSTVNNMVGTATINGATYQQQELSPVSVPKIKVVHASYVRAAGTPPNAEALPNNDVYIGTSVFDNVNTALLRGHWQGERIKRLPSWGITISDDINYSVTANTPYAIRTAMFLPGYDAKGCCASPSYATTLCGGASSWPLAGWFNDDALDTGTSGWATGSGVLPCHQAVLGYTGTNPSKSLVTLLDSQMGGTGDTLSGVYGSGWGMRIALQNFNLNATQANSTAMFGLINISCPGDTQANFNTKYQHQRRAELIGLCTTCIDNGGVNDLPTGGQTLGAMQTQKLLTAALVTAMGVKYIATTITPRTTSTDGWFTVGNQTQLSTETLRQNYNSWIRDTSAAGFIAQAAAATGLPTSMFGIYDTASYMEVNSSGTLTLNGGYWQIPTTTALYTGSVTTAGTASTFTDTGLNSATLNQYRGCVVHATSGANNYGTQIITATGAGTGVLSFQAFGSNFSNGDTYTIYGVNGPATIDGIHFPAWVHCLLAQNFPTSLVA